MKFTQADAVALCGVANEIRAQQASLNDLYTADWRQSYHQAKLCLSACQEFNEMLDEVKGAWKFYGTESSNDWTAALEEFIDVVHFMATVELCPLPSPTYEGASEQALLTWQASELSSNASLLRAISMTMRRGCFLQLLANGCRLFRITPEQLLVGYLHKNRKNQARASAGALTKDVSDIKAGEQRTFDYLYDNGFISLTREEYNMMVDAADE